MPTLCRLNTCLLLVCLATGVQNACAQKKEIPHGIGRRDNFEEFKTPGAVNRADGYLIYNDDTLKGIITLDKYSVWLERPVNDDYSFYYYFRPSDLKLKAVIAYNVDNKPLYLTRVTCKDHKLLRLVHEGKVNIYDDRFGYIYAPNQIDKNLVVISCDGKVKEMGSFFAINTKRSLIGYINHAYNLNIDPKTISWKDLLLTVDGLE